MTQKECINSTCLSKKLHVKYTQVDWILLLGSGTYIIENLLTIRGCSWSTFHILKFLMGKFFLCTNFQHMKRCRSMHA